LKGEYKKMSEEFNNDVENEEIDNIIVLNDENGEEVPFEFLDLIELDGEEYVVLLPVEEDDTDADEVVILRLEDTESEDEESYVSVDDEEVLNKVFEMFKEKFKDEFNFVD
jgi:uncharacterized protein YrzB (UPF0473 family)